MNGIVIIHPYYFTWDMTTGFACNKKSPRRKKGLFVTPFTLNSEQKENNDASYKKTDLLLKELK